MRTGLGKKLDQALRSFVPDLLEPIGFRPIKRPRTWKRTDHIVEQILAIEVDGRFAPDGYLNLGVAVGLTYQWEQEEQNAGWLLAGRHPVHNPGRLAPSEHSWRFTSAYGLSNRPELGDYLTTVVIPALDRWRDPASLRNHYLIQGRVANAIELSVAVGDGDFARRLVPAVVESTIRRLQADQPTSSPSSAGTALEIADDLNVELPPADRAYFLADLAATINRWRAWDAPLPDWVVDLETRFLSN